MNVSPFVVVPILFGIIISFAFFRSLRARAQISKDQNSVRVEYSKSVRVFVFIGALTLIAVHICTSVYMTGGNRAIDFSLTFIVYAFFSACQMWASNQLAQVDGKTLKFITLFGTIKHGDMNVVKVGKPIIFDGVKLVVNGSSVSVFKEMHGYTKFLNAISIKK